MHVLGVDGTTSLVCENCSKRCTLQRACQSHSKAAWISPAVEGAQFTSNAVLPCTGAPGKGLPVCWRVEATTAQGRGGQGCCYGITVSFIYWRCSGKEIWAAKMRTWGKSTEQAVPSRARSRALRYINGNNSSGIKIFSSPPELHHITSNPAGAREQKGPVYLVHQWEC